MFIEPTTAVSVGVTAWKHRDSLLPILRKLRYLLRHGSLRIASFGAGGTGKTTLGKLLSGEFSLGTVSTAYKTSLKVEDHKLKGDIVCSMIVPPGQESFSYTWNDLYRDLTEGKSGGVINVVSWGYNSLELPYKETKYYTPNMTEQQFLDHYTQESRQREMKIIESLVPHLRIARKKIWMITLVTKQDLWWNNRVQVRDYYMNGEYNKFIEQVTLDRGRANFAHEYLSVSLVISNFTTGSGEVLAQTTAGYDQNIQVAHMNRLLETIYNFSHA